MKTDEAKFSEKFKDLYNSRTETQTVLAELTTTVKMLVQNMDKQFNSIDGKLDEINKRIDTIARSN